MTIRALISILFFGLCPTDYNLIAIARRLLLLSLQAPIQELDVTYRLFDLGKNALFYDLSVQQGEHFL